MTAGIGITEETYQELERLINDAKPASRHLAGKASVNQTGCGPFFNSRCCISLSQPGQIARRDATLENSTHPNTTELNG
ncbi:Hypothetical protein ABZS17I87_03296 [Kosakonia cowanii]